MGLQLQPLLLRQLTCLTWWDIKATISLVHAFDRFEFTYRENLL